MILQTLLNKHSAAQKQSPQEYNKEPLWWMSIMVVRTTDLRVRENKKSAKSWIDAARLSQIERQHAKRTSRQANHGYDSSEILANTVPRDQWIT